MPNVVMVSSVEQMDKLKMTIEELFKKGQYAELTQAIGMHSILIDPQHTLGDQAGLYRMVLNMIKDRISRTKDKKNYATWYTAFPKLMDELVSSKQVVADAATVDILSTYRESYGAFKSVDDFFSWALADRRLTLGQIVLYIEKTAEMQGSKA